MYCFSAFRYETTLNNFPTNKTRRTKGTFWKSTFPNRRVIKPSASVCMHFERNLVSIRIHQQQQLAVGIIAPRSHFAISLMDESSAEVTIDLSKAESVGVLYTEQEIIEYAESIGMDLENDSDLLWIAKEGIKAQLPEDWKKCTNKETGELFYFNIVTEESSLENPSIWEFKHLYMEEKRKKEHYYDNNVDDESF